MQLEVGRFFYLTLKLIRTKPKLSRRKLSPTTKNRRITARNPKSTKRTKRQTIPTRLFKRRTRNKITIIFIIKARNLLKS